MPYLTHEQTAEPGDGARHRLSLQTKPDVLTTVPHYNGVPIGSDGALVFRTACITKPGESR